jgi:RNAse (barnase) inhibitor barstar
VNAKKPTLSEVPTPIALDAGHWKSTKDFYVALLAGLKAPEWHGHNLDALWDSLGAGSINEIEPPISISISNAKRVPPEVTNILKKFVQLADELKQEEGKIVTVDIES